MSFYDTSMSQTTATTELTSRVIATRNVKWRNFSFIQQEDFKELSPPAKEKLKRSILENKFTQPFYVWEDPASKETFCLDVKHRTMILEELINEGHNVPEKLPATFINCADKKEAAKLVLIYSSIYAKITEEGFHSFIETYNLDLSELMKGIDLPDFSFDHYLQKYDHFQLGDDPPFVKIDEDKTKVKTGDLFEINGHRILCGDSTRNDVWNNLMGGRKANLTFTSPPYNMDAGMYDSYKDNLKREEFLEMNRQVISNVVHNLSGMLFYNISYNRNSRSEFIDILHFLKTHSGATFLELIVWNKKTAMPVVSDEMLTRQYEQIAVISSDDCMIDMEIFYAGSKGRKAYLNKRIGKTMTNYWEIPVNTSKIQFENHHACFPMELPCRAIQLSTKTGEIVCDPFLGMGTTLLSSDELDRVCYAIEMQPEYIHGSILRYVLECRKKIKPIDFKHLNGNLSLSDFCTN